MHPLWHLDEPALIKETATDIYRVKGWIAAEDRIDSIKIVEQNEQKEPIFQISLHKRPDLDSALEIKGLKHIGFEGTCSFEKLGGRTFITIQYHFKGEKYDIIAPVYTGKKHTIKNKNLKLKRLIPYLICSVCKAGNLIHEDKTLKCLSCSSSFPIRNDYIDFITEELKQQFNIVSTDNVSKNEYDAIAINYINKFHDGLILDCGAGSRNNYYENVVNYEIVAYPSTDILGVGESLPFKDETFDVVFSFAVLEHVKDPVICASEIKRVLKKGGHLYCQIPFLQPFHGFPHHYYNMTHLGFENLFTDQMVVQQLAVMDLGQPIHMLNWFLQLYVDGLPPRIQKKFINMKIKDFLTSPNTLLTKKFVSQLSSTQKQALACCNYMLATKRG